MLYIFSVDVVSFSLCPKRAACGLTGSTQFNSASYILKQTARYTAAPYTKWMLHIADFSGQWSALLATWIGHCHGMNFFICGMNAFGYSLCRRHPNHGCESELCFQHNWNVAQSFATLPGHCWIKRILA